MRELDLTRFRADLRLPGEIMTTIALADDHHVVRAGLWALVESEPDLTVVGEAADGLEALQIVEKQAPDILIVDAVMPGGILQPGN